MTISNECVHAGRETDVHAAAPSNTPWPLLDCWLVRQKRFQTHRDSRTEGSAPPALSWAS